MFIHNEMKMTRKLKTDIRQNQIADAAQIVVAHKGMGGLNMASIAGVIGLVPSAIYRHYRSKDDVLDAVLERVRDQLMGNIAAVREESHDSLGRLELLLQRHARLLEDNRAIPRILFSEEFLGEHSDRRVKLRRVIGDYLTEIRTMIEHGQSTGEIRPDIPAATAAMMFLGLIQPAAIVSLLSEGSFSLSEHAQGAWRILSAAIRAEGESPRLQTADSRRLE